MTVQDWKTWKQNVETGIYSAEYTPVASLTKEVNPWLAKCPLKTNGRLANLTSLVKEATGICIFVGLTYC